MSSLCIRPVEVPGSLSFVFCLCQSHFMHLFVCKTCRSASLLVFCILNRIVNSEALREKLTCYLIVKRKVTCLDDQ